jgi:protein involved in polysaccharide export with SLBB domain
LKDFEEEYFIEVNGYVRTPKRVPYYKNMKLKDVLLLCGGLRLDAENGRIEISNVVDSISRYAIESKGNQIKIVSIDANLELDKSSENIIIKPMDRIYVRRKSEFLATEKVQVIGEVEYPGEFVLVGRNERLSSIIQRAGGLKKTAYSEGARLFRAKIGQVVIQKKSTLDIVLKDSDVIIIPSLNDIVSIRGEVQSSTNIKFDPSNMDIRYYIAAAGGYADRPWKNRIYIKYQNGRIKSTKNYLIARVYPKVKEGSTIYVPLKPKKENTTKFSEVFSYSLSALTTLATLLILSRSL